MFKYRAVSTGADLHFVCFIECSHLTKFHHIVNCQIIHNVSSKVMYFLHKLPSAQVAPFSPSEPSSLKHLFLNTFMGKLKSPTITCHQLLKTLVTELADFQMRKILIIIIVSSHICLWIPTVNTEQELTIHQTRGGDKKQIVI